MVFDTLIKINMNDNSFTPRLAKSWEVSTDAKTYTFTIADNIKWHDGVAFTAEDVLFSFNAMMRLPEGMFKSYFSKVQGAQEVLDGKATTLTGVTVSGNKVIIALSAPDNYFLKAMCIFNMLPKHLLKDVDPTLLAKNETFWKKPIGTGPYYIDEVSFPNYFTLQRFDGYNGKKANIKKVLFTSYATGKNEAVIAAAMDGKIDFATGNSVNDSAIAKQINTKLSDMKIMTVPSSYNRQLWVNTVGSKDGKHNDAMKKVEVRQALNLLLDKEAISALYKGQAVALSTFINPGDRAYNMSIPLFKRNVAEAKTMLTKAGFDFTKSVRILYYYTDQTTIDIMEMIKQNFAEAGVKAEPFLATGDLASIIYTVKNWDLMYAGAGNPDPIKMYTNLVPDNGVVDGLYGDIDLRTKVFGTLLSKYSDTLDAAEDKKIGDEIQLESNKYCYVMPVYGLNKIYLYNSAKLKLDEKIYSADLFGMCDYMFEKWELLK